jgi:hypothetical protein
VIIVGIRSRQRTTTMEALCNTDVGRQGNRHERRRHAAILKLCQKAGLSDGETRDVLEALESGDDRVPFRQRLGCTVAEACSAIGVKPTLLYGLISDGVIQSKLVGRRRVVSVPSLVRFLEGESTAEAA